MNELMSKETITSKELLEQINIFRQQDGKKELRHDILLRTIRDEFEEEINAHKIVDVKYKDKKGEERPMYVLTLSQAKQVLVRESKFVRKAVIKYIEELEEQIKQQANVPQLSYDEQMMIKAFREITDGDMIGYSRNVQRVWKN